MSILASIVLPALIPVLVDGVKTGIERLVGVRAKTVEEVLQLKQAEVNKLTALAQLDNPWGTPDQWVVNLRASARYIFAFVVMVFGGMSLFMPDLGPELKATAMEAISAAFFFMLGEGLWNRAKNKE